MFFNGEPAAEPGTVLLVTANNEYEQAVIQDILKDNNIPFVAKDHMMGDLMRVLCGNSVFGVDIFVSDTDFEQAKELVDAFTSGEAVELLEDGDPSPEDREQE